MNMSIDEVFQLRERLERCQKQLDRWRKFGLEETERVKELERDLKHETEKGRGLKRKLSQLYGEEVQRTTRAQTILEQIKKEIGIDDSQEYRVGTSQTLKKMNELGIHDSVFHALITYPNRIKKIRCHNYDIYGNCSYGNRCTYIHGNEEYYFFNNQLIR